MRRTSMLAAVALAAFSGAVVSCDDDGSDPTFTADLDVAAEAPTPTTVAGSALATGTATFTLGEDDELTVNISVSDLSSDVQMAHIHGPAEPGQIAPIIFDFTPAMAAVIAAGTRTGTIVSATYNLEDLPVSDTGVLRVERGTLLTLLNAGRTYVNVHTVLNPAGEVRGRIIRRDLNP